MIKLILKAIMILLLSFTLTSCSKNENDTYFVHAIGFDGKNDKITVTALLEKLGDDSKDYFITTAGGASITSAAKKISDKYKECYFATCDLYFLPSHTKGSELELIAKDICDSNIFPTTADVFCIKESDTEKFMKSIKNEDYIRKIKKNADTKINTIRFFSTYFSGKPALLGTFILTDDKHKYTGITSFRKGGKAVFNDK